MHIGVLAMALSIIKFDILEIIFKKQIIRSVAKAAFFE